MTHSDLSVLTPDEGRIVGYGGAVWIEGRNWTTAPGWTGLRALRKAKRWASRNGITLVGGMTVGR